MSIVIDKARAHVQELESIVNNPSAPSWQKDSAIPALDQAKKRLDILLKEDISKTTKDMAAIMSHTNAVNEKYNCRSVRFMFAVAAFLEKPRAIAPGLAKKIKDYVTKKINAPVCSIISSKKIDLPPMPQHATPAQNEWARRHAEDMEQIAKHKAAVDRLFKVK